MAGKRGDRRKKGGPKKGKAFETHNHGDGIIPFPSPPPYDPPEIPPSRLGAEQSLRELYEAIQEHEFSSIEELDAFIDAFNRGSLKSPTGSKPSRNPRHKAQELAYEAMETADPFQSARLCEKAIKLNPYCVDALMHLTRLSCEDGDEMIENMRMVVDIGERDLGGADYFVENKGHFWGLMETRPYMRARSYLAQSLVEAGQYREAIRHYEEMLSLNPSDNQGLRYPLLGLYLRENHLDGARRLFKEFAEDDGAVLNWSLVLERYLAGDESGAARALKIARKCNRHVEKFLTGKEARPESLPFYYGIGDENEAIICAEAIGDAWQRNPNAVKWLTQTK